MQARVLSNRNLALLWAALFVLTAALGFIPEPHGTLRAAMVAVATAFFLPPALLLYRAKKSGNTQMIAVIRNLSAVSLGLTLVLIVVNILCAFAGEFVGNLLHAMLTVVSAPMLCSTYWVASLFAWAVLLAAAVKKTPILPPVE